jgi:hypothetical protein
MSETLTREAPAEIGTNGNGHHNGNGIAPKRVLDSKIPSGPVADKWETA